MRSFVEKVRIFYRKGIYKKSVIDAMLEAGKITQAEYLYVTT